jgi:hypothetical protein
VEKQFLRKPKDTFGSGCFSPEYYPTISMLCSRGWNYFLFILEVNLCNLKTIESTTPNTVITPPVIAQIFVMK